MTESEGNHSAVAEETSQQASDLRNSLIAIPENLELSGPVDPKSAAPNSSQSNGEPFDFGNNNSVHYRRVKRTQSQQNARLTHLKRTSSFATSMGGTSIRSMAMDDHTPPPSTDEEKKKMTRRYFSTVFGIAYAIFLIIFGAVAFVGDAVKSRYPLVQAYSIVILSISLIYFVFLYIDIRVHIMQAEKANKEREIRMQSWEEYMANQVATINVDSEMVGGTVIPNGNTNIPTWNMPVVSPVRHKYCFATGRHGEFMYLKFGAAWFCFGLLIHSILQITYQIAFLASTDPNYAKCASVSTLVLELIFPIYAIFILFFIFKYINVIINAYRGFARLMLMHAIGTALAMWIFTIVRETADAINLAQIKEKSEQSLAISPTSIWQNQVTIDPDCPGPEVLNTIYQNFSPYLYPFIIEFFILIVGIWYMIWANISKCPKKLSSKGHGHEPLHGHDERPISSAQSEHCDPSADHEVQIKSNNEIHADCNASSRGLFAGLILVVLTIVFIILFFVAVTDEEYFYIGVTVNRSFELAVLAIMLVAVVVAYYLTSQLDINPHPMSMLDDVLLFIAIPAFFLETTFSMVPAIYNGSILNIFIIMTQLIQILIQTPFIIDGLRRCANHPVLRKKKPGRELVMFLTIANVSLWIFLTFSVKTEYTGDERYEFYGYTLWNILNHISLPLIMFYRFHSSVCLVDIWRHSYEPGGH